MDEVRAFDQFVVFVLSAGVGVGYCVLYDIERLIHKIAKIGVLANLFIDIFYWTILTVTTFSFLVIYCNGNVRFYFLVGELLGFVAFRLMFSKFVLKLFEGVYYLLKSVLHKILLPLNFIFKKITLFSKKIASKSNKLLKHKRSMLYNYLKTKQEAKINRDRKDNIG